MYGLLGKLDKVDDQESFLDFVRALAHDRRDRTATEKAYPHSGQPNGWERSTIEEYLSAVSWAEDSQGQLTGFSREATWRGFATFLYCGKIYE